MTKIQTFTASMVALILGVGLLVAGIVIKETVMSATGSGLIGIGVGGLSLPRPVDVPVTVQPSTPADTPL